MSRIPTIKSVMRPFPYSIQAGSELVEARRLFSEHRIRHLPVIEGEVLYGIVTPHDVERAVAEAIATTGTLPLLREIATRPAYAVDLDESLDNVLLHMAAERLGSVLIVRHDRVVGIFTTTDACRQFAEYLRRDLPAGGDDAA